jgi:hypothetical protein
VFIGHSVDLDHTELKVSQPHGSAPPGAKIFACKLRS